MLALYLTAANSQTADGQSRTAQVPDYIQAAVDDSSRPESDRKRDPDRKPAEVLAFADIKRGEKVAELVPISGYYTRLLCRIVGDDGHVAGINFTVVAPRQNPVPSALGCNNVTQTTQKTTELALPAGLDLVWTTENYHDFHIARFGSPNMMKFDRTIYDALKPGGVFIIEDHAAAAGSGANDSNTLHRIDPALVKQEVEAVGFRLIAESNLLSNPADDHTVPVFKIADKTDRFLLKFQKPSS